MIKEKEEAKEEFEEAKEEGKSASLLSEERPNVFTMNIANIMPGDNVSVDANTGGSGSITSTSNTLRKPKNFLHFFILLYPAFLRICS